MKITEMSAEQGLEVVSDAIEPIANLCEDEKTLEILGSLSRKKGENNIKFLARVLRSGVDDYIKRHSSDIIFLLSLVNNKDASVYEGKSGFATLLDDLKALANNDEVKVFFGFAPTKGESESAESV